MILPNEPSCGAGPKFAAGELIVSEGAHAVLAIEDIRRAFARHIVGDWGDVCADDAAANVQALADKRCVVSVYHSVNGTKFYLITEANRQHTVVLLPDEY